MNYVKLKFICNTQPDHLTLHSLYTTIRFKQKEMIQDEIFQIWNDGRTIYIVMEAAKIENTNSEFSFQQQNGTAVKIKLINQTPYTPEKFAQGDYVYFRTVMSYAYKSKLANIIEKGDKRPKKFIEVCPINMKGSFNLSDNKSLKQHTITYLENETGLNFEAEKDTDKLRFERLFKDEHLLKTPQHAPKILLRNIFSIDATLVIKDIEKFNKILYGNIGKKRSYGFGKCFVDNLTV